METGVYKHIDLNKSICFKNESGRETMVIEGLLQKPDGTVVPQGYQPSVGKMYGGLPFQEATEDQVREIVSLGGGIREVTSSVY
jgi:hypothetical protein